MNPSTGEIRTFNSDAEAAAEGFTILLKEAALKDRLEKMTPEERVAWARDAHASAGPPGSGRAERRRAERAARRARRRVPA